MLLELSGGLPVVVNSILVETMVVFLHPGRPALLVFGLSVLVIKLSVEQAAVSGHSEEPASVVSISVVLVRPSVVVFRSLRGPTLVLELSGKLAVIVLPSVELEIVFRRPAIVCVLSEG